MQGAGFTALGDRGHLVIESHTAHHPTATYITLFVCAGKEEFEFELSDSLIKKLLYFLTTVDDSDPPELPLDSPLRFGSAAALSPHRQLPVDEFGLFSPQVSATNGMAPHPFMGMGGAANMYSNYVACCDCVSMHQ